MNSDGEGLALAQPKVSREQWKHRLPLSIRLIAHEGKTLGRRWLGVKESHWSRVIMDRETEQFVQRLPYASLDALEIAGDKWETFGFASYRSVSFARYDWCARPLEVEAFDIVIAEQVLEHVLWPYRAVRNAWKMLKPGGVFLVTTPFLLPIHHAPVDCCRWTELGLKHLLVEGGFAAEQIVTASWGNRACVGANLQKWARWIPWKHSLENDPRFPVVVWGFARKNLHLSEK